MSEAFLDEGDRHALREQVDGKTVPQGLRGGSSIIKASCQARPNDPIICGFPGNGKQPVAGGQPFAPDPGGDFTGKIELEGDEADMTVRASERAYTNGLVRKIDVPNCDGDGFTCSYACSPKKVNKEINLRFVMFEILGKEFVDFIAGKVRGKSVAVRSG